MTIIETGKLLYKYKYSKTTETTSSLHKYVKAVLTPPYFKNEDEMEVQIRIYIEL